jgi:DNA polymerase-3 subunit gamma/tau
LEQLLAFSPGRITVADVHGMLGTAGEERLAELVRHLIDRNPAAALADLDAALGAGVDPALLLEQLLGYLRDCMAAAVGCPGEAFLYTSPSGAEQVVEVGKLLGLNTLLAVMQILDQALSRMRYSTQGRILAELALVRISHLEDLDELSEVIAQLQSGVAAGPGQGVAAARPAQSAGPPAAPAAVKKKYEPATPPPEPVVAMTAENVAEIWTRAISRLSGRVVDQAKQFDSLAILAPNRLVIRFKPGYAWCKSACERPEQVARFEQALSDVTGQRIRVEFTLVAEVPGETEPSASPGRVVSPHQRLLGVVEHPLVQRASELFGAQPIRVDDPPDNPLTK